MNRKYFTILISLCALLLSVVLVGAQDAGEPTITYSAVFRVSDA